MRNHPSWTMFRASALFAASAFVIAACGGSVEFRAGPEGAAGNAAGGAPSAGAPSAGAPSAGAQNAGAPGAGTSAGGQGAGGGKGCGDVACLDFGCGPGYKSVLDLSGCCTTCVPDGSGGTGGGNECAKTLCPAIACVSGTKYQIVPGECCGTCVPDPDACNAAQAKYQDLRQQLLAAPGALSCVTRADCRQLGGDTGCSNGCAVDAVSVKAAPGIEKQLNQFAANYCAQCPVEQPPCTAPLPLVCAGGMCIFGGEG